MSFAPLRILVVDDSVDPARMMALLLKAEGHKVKTAFDGAEALRVAADFRPDVVLLDMILPEISGTDVARAIREGDDTGDCCIVAVSGLDPDPNDPDWPFDHAMTKPVDHDALSRILAGIEPRPESGSDARRIPASA